MCKTSHKKVKMRNHENRLNYTHCVSFFVFQYLLAPIHHAVISNSNDK